MKYKKIIIDNKISKDLRKLNVSQIAKKLGVSKTYLYEALSEKYTLTEDFYKRLKDSIKVESK